MCISNFEFCIKFCVKNGKKAHEMLTMAYGRSTMSHKVIYKRYKRFTGGREDVDNDDDVERPGVATTFARQ